MEYIITLWSSTSSLSITHYIPPLPVPPLPFNPIPRRRTTYKTINPAKTAANKPPPSTANPAAAPLDSLGANPAEVVVVVAAAVSVVLVADVVVVAVAVPVEDEELRLEYAFAALQYDCLVCSAPKRSGELGQLL